MTLKFAAVCSLLFLPLMTIGQQTQKLSVESIWGPGSVYQVNSVDQVRSMNDGLHFSQMEGWGKTGVINKYSFKSYEKVGTIAAIKDMIPEGRKSAIDVQDYEFNSTETKLLLATNMAPIYRYSYTAEYWIFDIAGKKLTPLSKTEGPQRQATFSPDGKHVAFVRDNNVFITNIETGEETQVTTDGEANKVINGYADWVYEEEFALTTGLEWSANGTKLAYYRMDESAVPEFQMAIYGDLYPFEYRFKYPKAGEANSVVSIHVYDLTKKKSIGLDTGTETDQYIPRIKWTKNDHQLCVLRMNRHQSKLEYLLYDMDPAKVPNSQGITPKTLYTETSDSYIEIDDNLIFLKDGNSFIRTSEKDGYNHIYRIDLSGNATALTSGNWDVIEFKGVNEEKGLIYYTSAEEGAIYRSLYVVDMKGKKTKLSSRKGTNDAFFSTGMKYYLNFFSSANQAEIVTLHDATGKELKVLESNVEAGQRMKDMNFVQKEFITVKGAAGDLNAWIMKPADFDPNKKYPVYMHIYCGPGHNTVLDEWGGRDFYWHQLLVQKGYVVMSVDPRGTMYRGAAFKKSTYMNLGKLELEDLVAVANNLKKESWVDGSRIGIMGWSYGGYMSSLAMTKAAGVFAMGIAVAPVTTWRYYDSIYTERFMRTPQENPSGYDDNSPINYVKELKDPYLIVHGSADDNVHMQNAMDMINALVNSNKQFDMFVYPNKNHGIYGGWTRVHLYNRMLMFIEANL
jgi:dipeptidyl-peptidase-4